MATAICAVVPSLAFVVQTLNGWIHNLSQNAKRASARKDTGLDQSLFYVQLFRLRINII